jgi:hypothetical protein
LPASRQKTARSGINDYDVRGIWLRFRIISIPL